MATPLLALCIWNALVSYLLYMPFFTFNISECDSVSVKCLTFRCRYDTNQLWHTLVPDDPKEIQFIQLFTKHEMSLISYREVWHGLHSGACISFHPLILFMWTYRSLLSSRHFFTIDGSSPVLKTSLCSSLVSATLPDLNRPSIFLAFYKLHYPY